MTKAKLLLKLSKTLSNEVPFFSVNFYVHSCDTWSHTRVELSELQKENFTIPRSHIRSQRFHFSEVGRNTWTVLHICISFSRVTLVLVKTFAIGASFSQSKPEELAWDLNSIARDRRGLSSYCHISRLAHSSR